MTGTEELRSQIPEMLKRTMKARSLTFKELSRNSGVPLKTLYHWANGQNPRNILDLYKVAKVLGTTLEVLIMGSDSKPTGQIEYELVLFKITEDNIRERLTSLPQSK